MSVYLTESIITPEGSFSTIASPELFSVGKFRTPITFPKEENSDAEAVRIKYSPERKIVFDTTPLELPSEMIHPPTSTGFRLLLYISRNSAGGSPIDGDGS